MPHNFIIEKEATARAQSLKHLEKILNRTGKKLGMSAHDAVKQLYTKGGSGSLMYDVVSNIPKKVLRFGGKKVKTKTPLGITKIKKYNTIGDKIKSSLDNALERYQRKAIDVDIRAGNYITKKLKNTKAEGLAEKMFVDKTQFKVKNVQKNAPNEILEVETPRLTAPIDKAKNTVLPLVGGFTLASKIDEAYHKDKSKAKGGEAMKKATNKEELIEKIAETIAENNVQLVVKGDTDLKQNFKKLAELANKSTEMLKMASTKLKQDAQQIEKLADENKRLKLQLIAKNRSERSVKLANLMYRKGIIKKAQIQDKIDEIMDMSDEAYEILAETVENVKIEKTAEEGVDSLYFIADDSSSEAKTKSTLADEIDKLAKSY